jgi:PAS domain S-box-containing protein
MTTTGDELNPRGEAGEIDDLRRQVAGLTERLSQESAARGQAEALARSLRKILDRVPDAIHVIDPRTSLLRDVNMVATRLGYTVEELRGGMGIVDIEAFLPEHFSWEAHVKDVKAAGTVMFPGEHRRKDGTTFPVEVHVTYVDNDGDPFMLAVIRDGSQRTDAEAKLRQIHEKLVEAARRGGMAEVATGVLHNIGNVLNSVNISANLVLAGLRDSKVPSLVQAAELLGEHEADLPAFVATDRGRKLVRFVREVVAHVSAEAHSMSAETTLLLRNIDHINNIVAAQQRFAQTGGQIEAVSLRELVEHALSIQRSAAPQSHVEPTIEVVDASVMLDKHKVLQILVNLLSNAEYAVQGTERSQVRVHAGPAGDRLRIAVSDNGVGIPTENLARVFELGFTTRPLGHGFGLHVSATFARELGGTIECHSDGPGRGATFTLDLPLRLAGPA